MYASDLLSRIRRDLDTIPEYIARIGWERQENHEGPPDVVSLLGNYNYATYTGIRGQNTVEPDFPLDPGRVNECEEALHRYLDRYAPGNRELKTYVIAISLYLVFIARMPLHPPGAELSQGIRITKREDAYICTGKARYLRNPDSLCRFCICRSGKELGEDAGQ